MAKFFRRIRAFLRGETFPPRRRNPFPPLPMYRPWFVPEGHATALSEWVKIPPRAAHSNGR